MSLSSDDLVALEALVTRAVERIVAPVADNVRELSARQAAVESRLVALGRVTEAGFTQIVGRLDALEERVGRIEERLDRLSADATRVRTSVTDRVAQLEARVAELEAKLEGKH